MKSGRLELALRTVVALLILSFTGSSALACWPYVTGSVVLNGQPAENVLVEIHNTGDGFICGPQDVTDYTDADGEFSTCVQCAGNVTVTIQDEPRTQYVNGLTDFGEWQITGVAGDNDRDGIDDGYEDYLLYKFAPKVWLHSNENRWPVNVDWMLPRTHMRYHHRWCSDDEIISHGNVNNFNITEQCHRDKRLPGNGWPWEYCDHEGSCNPSDHHVAGWKGGFFLQYYNPSHTGSTDRRDWVTYGHVYPASYNRIMVQYWQAYSYNDSLGSANHEGDWEYTSVLIDLNEVPQKVFFYMHGRAKDYNPAEVEWDGDHHVTYSAKGSHAQYKGFGGWPIRCDTTGVWDEIQFYADHCDRGHPWDTWDSDTYGGIVNLGETGFLLNDSNWLRYSGRWGEYGFASGIGIPGLGYIQFTSGPHGPAYQGENWHLWGATELCDNGVDDDIDGTIDEASCNAAPDLAMSDTEPAVATDGAPGSITVAPGDPFQVRCGLDNLGGQIHGPFRLDFFLSEDDVLGPEDFQTSECLDLFGMPPTTSYPPIPTFEVTVPAGTPDGAYRVIAVADSNEALVEEDETNNTLVSENLVRVVRDVGAGSDTLLLTNFDSRSAPEFTPVAGSWDAGLEVYCAHADGTPADDTVSLLNVDESETRTELDVWVRDWDGAHDLAWGVLQRYVDGGNFLRVDATRSGEETLFRLIDAAATPQVLASGTYVGDPDGEVSGSGTLDKGIVHVQIDDTGDHLCLYVNGQEVMRTPYSSAVAGPQHGLFVNSGNTVDFDNVHISRLVDADGDGWTVCAGDCDDSDPLVHPGRSEVCGTSVDDDCDGQVNEGCGGGGCFAAGARVLMADGSTRSIEAVEVGDWVQSFDVEQGTSVPGRVVETFTRNENLELLVLEDRFRVTPRHEFYTQRGWVPAAELRIGDTLGRLALTDTPAAGLLPRTLRSVERFYGRTTVYNFEVEGMHNYFVDGVLVHNRKADVQEQPSTP